MKSISIQVGDTFGRWRVVGEFVRQKNGQGRGANYPVLYPCLCECGTERLVRAFKLLSNSKSCGCLKLEELTARMTIHGMNRRSGRHPLYTVWDGMRQRCTNPSNDNFAHYGGRGIAIEWPDFNSFAQWAIANNWRHGMQIDRRDNDGPYSADNCRFVTDAQNKRNTRSNAWVTAFGETKCATDWAIDRRCSVTPSTIRIRLRSGMSPEDAISTPRRTRLDASRFAGH